MPVTNDLMVQAAESRRLGEDARGVQAPEESDRFRPASGGADAQPAGVDRPAPADRLPARRLEAGDAGVAVWWLGVHGGAGESTLEELFSGSRAAGHAWPLGASDADRPRVVLVARTNARGLRSTQNAIRDCAGAGWAVGLVGLVLIADAPGRLPRALRDLAALIAGGVARVWWLPWVEAWRAGETPTPANCPREVRGLLGDLRAITSTGPDQPERGVL